MKISVVIPCFNEIATIEEVLRKVSDVHQELEKEIIVVDDFSTDGTRDYLKSVQAVAQTTPPVNNSIILAGTLFFPEY